LPTAPGNEPSNARQTLGQTVEVFFVLVICMVLFLVGLERFDLIKTEGLRAVVVAEMLEQPELAMPTVHHRPYTKKPPLYAWCTTLLARAAGRFDEQIARLPSALAGGFLALLLFGVAEARLGRGAGLIAAALLLANPTIVDYSMRAELDMGFALLTTVSMLLAYEALRRRGVTGVVCWMACYLAATLAALWKAPHSLIFLWVPLLAYGWRKREWRWLWNPAQVAGLLLSLGVLVIWAVTLSTFAGNRNVAETAAIELVSRLVPLSGEDLLSVIYAVPMMAVIVLPASLFVIASFRSGVVYSPDDKPTGRSVQALARFCVGRFRSWWQAVAQDPFAEFLLFWLFANLAWCSIVPAKAPRYWLPMFPPVVLLAAHLLLQGSRGTASATGRRHLDLAWRGIFGVLGVIGLLSLAMAAIAASRPELTVAGASLGPAGAWLAMGLGWTILAVVEFARSKPVPIVGRCLGLLVIVLAAKPLLSEAWWPARAASDSQRLNAARIDATVPAGQPVFVLGRHELPDVEFYSQRRFEWLDHVNDAASLGPAGAAYYLLRTEDLDECVAAAGLQYDVETEFQRADKSLSLIRIRPTPSRSPQPPG
jgi:4-amino-4-deoxy-L-arabinose transferase-like glycosyltransferase